MKKKKQYEHKKLTLAKSTILAGFVGSFFEDCPTRPGETCTCQTCYECK